MTCLYCDRRMMARGLCSTHYLRWQNRRPMEAPLNTRRTQPTFASKRCRGCGEEKPVAEFREKTDKHRQGICSLCDNANRRKRYAAWPEARRRAHKLAGLRGLLLREFNLTLEQYTEMLRAQGGVCAVCRKPETSRHQTGQVKRLAVDHDHACCPGIRSCGRCIRGLLCHACNVSTGQLGEDPVRMRALADYVEHRSVKKESAA